MEGNKIYKNKLEKLTPEHIKTQALSEIPNMIPKEGEMIQINGGLGNRILSQIKQENGIFYRRENENDEWQEYDMAARVLEVVTNIRISAQKNRERSERRNRKWYRKLFK